MAFYWLTCSLVEISSLCNVRVLCNAKISEIIQPSFLISSLIIWFCSDLLMQALCCDIMQNKKWQDPSIRLVDILPSDFAWQCTLSLSWLDCGGGGSLSLLLSLPSSCPLLLWVSRRKEEEKKKKRQRRLTSTGCGESDGKREVERLAMEWRRAWKDGERKRDRGRGRSKEQALEC